MMRLTAGATAIVIGLAMPASAQVVRSAPLTGTEIGGNLRWDGDARRTTATASLLFKGDDGLAVFSIDFVVQYSGQRPAMPPRVVDMVITQHSADEEHPQVRLQADATLVPVVARYRSSRSVVISMPFEEFVRLTSAETVIEHAFDTDLLLSAGQLRMLRTTAARWAGR